jgi:pantoate--beta-alanine ligase
MILFKKSEDLINWLKKQKNESRTVGFVPTMGALHEGHMHLIETCRSASDVTVCSIFVNPAQFNDPKDFEKYPISLETDIDMLVRAGTDALFLPPVSEIYPGGSSGLETYDLGSIESILEGRFRPGHFQGVCQVMSRLLGLVKPDDLFMGQKDYQQCLVIEKLIMELKLKIRFHMVSTVRETDGLALSSRNRRLNPEQRKNAIAISQALFDIKNKLRPGDTDAVLKEARIKLESAHFKTDYICIADLKDLQPIQNWNGEEKAVALIAAYQGEVRLIDNLQVN